MSVCDVIAAKRDGQELADGDIRELVLGYTADRIPDYQMAAFLMAAYIRGLSFKETLALTRAMVESGTRLDLSAIAGTKVDKHSTGGVGDKTTLVLVPMLAACGLKVPKMSGRGLGHTGGTLDKLESIPGFTTALTIDRFITQVERIGAAIAGQSSDIVPADKKIYALRDVTATTDSIPLIAASVMSKKIACGSDLVVLDVKTGSGAFMREHSAARDLAATMVDIGKHFGLKVAAAVTNMDQPLGYAVGNALEVAEAIETLKGSGPSDLRELCIRLCALSLSMVGEVTNEEAIGRAQNVLDSGAALTIFEKIVEAQGGNPRIIDNLSLLPQAGFVAEVQCPVSGVVESIDCARIGRVACTLGAGRERKEDKIDHAVGVVVRKKLGDYVEQGEPIAVLHANRENLISITMSEIRESYTIGEKADIPPLIREIISPDADRQLGTKQKPRLVS